MSSRCSSGFTLIEMVIAIVIISVGLAGVLLAFNVAVQSSADPLVHKQMLSVAEEMMEEILLKPFPASIPPSTNFPTSCGGASARRADFDDVADYDRYETTGICDIDGQAVAGLASYSVQVTIDAAATLGALGGGSVIKVMVVVTHGTDTITLVGWRTKWAA